MLLPDFTEDTERESVLYFRVGEKNAEALLKEALETYPCAGAAGTAMKNGELCVALTVDLQES